MKILFITLMLILPAYIASAGNKGNWPLLVKDIRSFTTQNKSAVTALRLSLNEPGSDKTTLANMASQLDMLYARTKEISFRPLFNNNRYFQHQEILKAIRKLKIELEVWKEFNNIKIAEALPVVSGQRRKGPTDTHSKDDNRERSRFTTSAKYSNLQKDIYRVSRNSETRLQNCIVKENAMLKAELDTLETDQRNNFGQLEAYHKGTQNAITYSYESERYTDLLKAFRELEEITAFID